MPSFDSPTTSLVLEDVFDIKAASLDIPASLYDDDPSLRSFPINNGLFDDDRMGALWKPTDEVDIDEIIVLDSSHPPLSELLGRTVEDCFRGFPSPSNMPSPLSDSTFSSPNTSPWCEHWHPLPKEDPDPAIDIVLDEMKQKMRIDSPSPPPEPTLPLQATVPAANETPVTQVRSTAIKNPSTLAPGVGNIMEPTNVKETASDGRGVVEASTLIASITPMRSSRLRHAALPKASLRPCKTNLVLASSPSPIEEPEIETPHNPHALRSQANVSQDGPSSEERVDDIPSPPSPKRTTRRRNDDDEYVEEVTMNVDSPPPSKKIRVSPSPSAGSSNSSTRPALKKGKKPSSSSAGSSGSSTRGRRSERRYKCPEPWCGSTFSRLGDVTRHLKNASAHITSLSQLDERARCSKCGVDLSRADARKRHELKGSCGKRTIRKRGIAMPRLPQA